MKALLLVGLSSFGQFQFRILEQTTLLPVEYAQVMNHSGKVFYADSAGIVSCDSSSVYQISSLGYEIVTTSLSQIIRDNYVVYLKQEALALEDVEIEVNSLTNYRINEGLRQKEEVVLDDAPAKLSGTVPDVLEQSGKVYIQKSQQGGGSPVLRGFEANRVLLLVDGIRMNNAIYRSGHLQNSTTIDPLMLQGIDVFFGPGSLNYGSDAIGGAINFKTKSSPFIDSTDFSADILLRTGSVDFEKTLGFSAVLRKKKSVTDFVFRISDYDDLKSGKQTNIFNDFEWLRESYVDQINGEDSLVDNPDPYRQIGSSYGQVDFFIKHRRRMGNDLEQHLSLQVSTSTDVPRFDRLGNDGDAPTYARWDYGPQNRIMLYGKQLFYKPKKLYDALDVTLSLQGIQESRINRRFKSDFLRFREEQLIIGGLSVSAIKQTSRYGEFQYGGDVYYNKVFSDAFRQNIKTNEISNLSTRYPSSGSQMTLGGLYVNQLIEKKKWQFHDGVRLDLVGSGFRLDSAFSASGFNEVSQLNIALSAGAGVNYNPKDWLSFLLNSQTAFRAPNIDDLSKVFDSNPGEVIVPNNNLKAERSLALELLSKIELKHKLTLSLGANYNRVFNLISVSDFNVNGNDSIFYDGALSRVTANQNNDFGHVYGAFYNLDWEMKRGFMLNSSLTFTRGRLDNGENMAHIPPVYGRTSLEKKFFTEKNLPQFLLVSRYNFNKPLNRYSTQSADRLDLATPSGIPAFLIFDILVSYTVKKWELNGGVKNFLDTHYRTFSSGINAPGRNFVVSINYSL